MFGSPDRVLFLLSPKFTIITQHLVSNIISETTNAINEITDEKKINIIRLSVLFSRVFLRQYVELRN